MRRRSRGAALLCLALTTLGACGHDSGEDAGSPDGTSATPVPTGAASSPADGSSRYQVTDADFRAVRALMRARARALLGGDLAAFMATVDHTDPDVVAAQKVFFHNVTALPLASLRYAVGDAALVPDDVEGDDPTFRPEAYEHLGLARTFSHPVSNPVTVTFVRRDGSWLVGAESEPDAEDGFGAPQVRPWFGGPIAATRVGATTAITDADQRASAAPLARRIRADLTADAGVLGIPTRDAVLVDATSNGQAHRINSVSGVEAAAVTFQVFAADPLQTTYTARAGLVIKLNPDDVDSLMTDEITLRHELTHSLLTQYAGAAPKWATEGIAQYVAYRPAGGMAALVVSPDTYRSVTGSLHELPNQGLFGLDPYADYAVGQAAVTYLVETGGMPRFLDLLDAYVARYSRPGGDDLTDPLLRRFYGLDGHELAVHARDLLRERLG